MRLQIDVIVRRLVVSLLACSEVTHLTGYVIKFGDWSLRNAATKLWHKFVNL